ncbi:hypothetical protein BLA29_011499, partial [Euroglyphus maynei]
MLDNLAHERAAAASAAAAAASMIDMEKFRCPYCTEQSSSFDNMGKFHDHIVTHICKKEIKFACDQCKNVRFERKKDLDEHLMDKHSIRLFRCQLCQQLFETKQSIQEHFETCQHYSKDLQLICIICDDHFHRQEDFSQHVKSKHNTMNLMQKLDEIF